jgi:cytochrome c oxidase subunit 2
MCSLFATRRFFFFVPVAAISAVVLLFALNDSGTPGDAPLTVDVFSKQYSWSFGYPGKGNAFSSGELRVPLGRQVQFRMYSQDVDHSFWVPEWRVKVDNPPGVAGTVTVTPDVAGTFQVICTQLCGIEHAYMRAKVVVEPRGKFNEWVDSLDQTVPPHLTELIRLDTELESIHEDAKANR